MANSSFMLIWILCSCVVFPVCPEQHVKIGVAINQHDHYDISFDESAFRSFQECLCNPNYERCKAGVVDDPFNDDHSKIKANPTKGESSGSGTSQGASVICQLTSVPWEIDCQLDSALPLDSQSDQYLTIENVGNNCSSECVQVRWHSSQNLTFQDQILFNAKLTHNQCPPPDGNVKENYNNMFIIVGVSMGGLVLVVLVLVVVLVVVRRRRGSGNVRKNNVPFNDASVAVGEKEEHYSEVQGDSLSSPSPLHDTSKGALFDYQNVVQDNSSVSHDTEPYQNSHAQLQEPNESTVYSEASSSSTGNNKTYAKLHEVRRDVMDVYGALEEME